MTCWIIIPIKAQGRGKQRLAAVLDADQRVTLVRDMLGHVVDVVGVSAGVDQINLLGPDDYGLHHIPRIPDTGDGLNAALTTALTTASDAGASRVVFIAADLPLLRPKDVEQLCHTPETTIIIAPDRHGSGTNALSLPLPAARQFRFAYGTGSFAAHDAEAYRLGLDVEILHSKGLARDIDLPEDLDDVAGLGI
jgi:2-phospho-L-lactate/phosphoenolpyruvate guanylyltransferase